MLVTAMSAAIESAAQGITDGEGGPFGAAIVYEGKILVSSHNTVLKTNDATCHAEMNAIRAASAQLQNHILDQCELYTTAEPCPMCMAAIMWARIPKVYVGVDRTIAAKYGFDDEHFYQQLALSHDDKHLHIEMNCSESDCESLFKLWKTEAGVLY